MSFEFATCDRNRALGFLRQVYPSSTIEDSADSAAATTGDRSDG